MCANCQEMAIALQTHPDFRQKMVSAAGANKIPIKSNFLVSCIVTADSRMGESNVNARRIGEADHYASPINLKAISKQGTLFFKDASKCKIDMGGFFSRNNAISLNERNNEKNNLKIKQLESENAELKRKLENKEESDAKRFK